MYLYVPPISIVKENNNLYRVVDLQGGIFRFDKKNLVDMLMLSGELIEELKEGDKKKAEKFIETGFFIPTKYKRKPYTNTKRVAQEILAGNGKRNDLMNIGSVTFAPVKFCPLKCSGCYDTDIRSDLRKPLFNKQTYLKTMEDIASLGATNVSLSGGEPTSSSASIEQVVTLAEMAGNEGIERIILITTGFGVSKYAKRLFSSPINHVQISIDGLPIYNDNYKKLKGITEKSESAIESCKEYGVSFSINMVVSKLNIDQILLLIEYLAKKGVGEMKISKVITDNPELSLTFEEAKEFDRKIKEAKKLFYPIQITSPFDLGHTQEGYINCVAGKLYAHITCFGDVYPCSLMMDKQPAGNIFKSRFKEIWNVTNPVLQPIHEGIPIDKEWSKSEERFYLAGNCIKEYQLRKTQVK